MAHFGVPSIPGSTTGGRENTANHCIGEAEERFFEGFPFEAGPLLDVKFTPFEAEYSVVDLPKWRQDGVKMA